MPVVQVEAELSAEQLLQAVTQLPEAELMRFVAKVNLLRPPRQERRLSRKESELLLKINQGIPSELQRRYNALIARREDETLTQSEYDELIQLTHQVETSNAKRVEHLIELARLRKISLDHLMDELGIGEIEDE